MPQVYVFWTQFQIPEVREWKWEEFRQGRLRQGWVGPGTQLVEQGKQVPTETWIPRFTAWVKTWETWKSPPRRIQQTISGAASRHRILILQPDLWRSFSRLAVTRCR